MSPVRYTSPTDNPASKAAALFAYSDAPPTGTCRRISQSEDVPATLAI